MRSLSSFGAAVEPHSVGCSTFEPGAHRKQKSRMVPFRMDEDDFSRLDTFAQQTSCSRAKVLRRLLRTARLESTVDAQALTEVSRVHADVNRIGGLLKLAIREGPRPKTAFTTTGAPPSHRIPGPQAEAHGSTEGDSEDSASWHMASFRRESHRTPRRSCDSTSAATRPGARPFG